MPARKLTKEIIKKIVEDRKKGVFRRDTLIKYDISKPTYRKATKIGIELGFLKLKEYKNLIEVSYSRGHEAKVKMHGKKKASQLCSKAWHEGMGKSHEKHCNSGDYKNSPLVKAAIAGGKKTQDVTPYVIENLKGAEAYGQYTYHMYESIKFKSKEELKLALILQRCGLIKKIREGKNCQVPCESKTIDFLVDGKAIEYHPPKKGEINNYKETRTKDLKDAGFAGEIIIIEKLSFNELFQAGIVKSLLEYKTIIEKADKKLEKIIKLEEELAYVPF